MDTNTYNEHVIDTAAEIEHWEKESPGTVDYLLVLRRDQLRKLRSLGNSGSVEVRTRVLLIKDATVHLRPVSAKLLPRRVSIIVDL